MASPVPLTNAGAPARERGDGGHDVRAEVVVLQVRGECGADLGVAERGAGDGWGGGLWQHHGRQLETRRRRDRDRVVRRRGGGIVEEPRLS